MTLSVGLFKRYCSIRFEGGRNGEWRKGGFEEEVCVRINACHCLHRVSTLHHMRDACTQDWLPEIASNANKCMGCKTYHELVRSKNHHVRQIFHHPPPKLTADFHEVGPSQHVKPVIPCDGFAGLFKARCSDSFSLPRHGKSGAV